MDDFLQFAHALADEAGKVIRPYFGQKLDVESKLDSSPVSIADREAEATIRALISQRHPDHGLFGEEHGLHHSDRRYTWVIDPIDGTRAFLAGKKEWGTLIALCDNGVPVLGLLDQPVTGERWSAVRGIDSHAFHTRTCSSLASASISTTSRHYFTPPQAGAFVKLADACLDVIADGDCYAYGLLARGERDLVADAGLKPYDILALVPIIEAAGGTITAWDGKPITLDHATTALAAGDAARHAEALAILNG